MGAAFRKAWFLMAPEKILPTILMLIQAAAAVPYIIQGNASLAVYWIAAAVLTFAVTWI